MLDQLLTNTERLSNAVKINMAVIRRVALILAVAGFAVGIALSIRAQPDILVNLSLGPVLMIILVAVPVTTGLNSLEFQMATRLLSQRISFRDSLETTIIGTAANMLPLPGSAMVKVARLKSLGVTVKSGAAMTLFMAMIWLGLALLYAGSWIVSLGGRAIGTILIVSGATIFVVAMLAGIRQLGKWRLPLQLSAIRLVLIVVDASRFLICLFALGLTGSFAQASALTVSSVLGSAVSIVPAGLGVREAVAAGVGPFVGLAASSAFVATSLNRILGLATIAPVAAGIAIRLKSVTQTGQDGDQSDHEV